MITCWLVDTLHPELRVALPPEQAEAVEAILMGPFYDGPHKASGAATQSIPPQSPRRQHKPRNPPPDGLKTAKQAAAKLGCSIKTLDGHVDSGALSYVPIGHGKKRVRRMFTDADLDQFIVNQTRKVTPCPSTAGRARHTGTMTFTGEVIDFTGPRKPPTSAKPRK